MSGSLTLNANTLFVAAEAQPLAKTGGLADVVGGLAQALAQRGADVTILMPGYPRAIAAARDVRSLGTIQLPMALPPGHSPARLLLGLMPDSGVRVAFSIARRCTTGLARFTWTPPAATSATTPSALPRWRTPRRPLPLAERRRCRCRASCMRMTGMPR
jgi:hypothetical protein